MYVDTTETSPDLPFRMQCRGRVPAASLSRTYLAALLALFSTGENLGIAAYPLSGTQNFSFSWIPTVDSRSEDSTVPNEFPNAHTFRYMNS